MFKLFLLLCLVLSFCLSKEQKIIHWNSVSFPPSLISQGELKNQGYSDIARNIIMKNMPEYEHVLEVGNSKLALINLRRLEFACFSGLNINSERKEFVYFSKPIIYSLPNEVIIKKSNQHKFKKYITQNNKMDLSHLLKDDLIKFGYVDSRSYNEHIDNEIQRYKSNKNSFARKGADLTRGLIHMLHLNRLDYIIEYPTMIKYNKAQFKIQEEFLYYPIEHASDLIQVYVGCSKSEMGQKYIKQINQIIEANQEEFLNAYKQWLPLDSQKRYERSIKNR